VVCGLKQQLILISSMYLNSALECSWWNLSDSLFGSLFGVRDRERVDFVYLEAMLRLLPLMVPPMVPPPVCRHSGCWPRHFKRSFFLNFRLLVFLRLVSCVSFVMHPVLMALLI
jgi:hypothetical protein